MIRNRGPRVPQLRVSSSNPRADRIRPAVGRQDSHSGSSAAPGRARPLASPESSEATGRGIGGHPLITLCSGYLGPELRSSSGKNCFSGTSTFSPVRWRTAPRPDTAPPTAAHALSPRLGADGVFPNTGLAFIWNLQADDRTHQHRLAGARASHHAEDFPPPHL